MLLIEIYRYIKRRVDKRPVRLSKFIDQSHHHAIRTVEPSVSIIIPTRDKVDLLRSCIDSIIEKTTYKNYVIVVVDNQSVNPETLTYMAKLDSQGVLIVRYPDRFNYSAICNYAASTVESDFLCFLNNDIEVIDGSWLDNLVDHGLNPEVGVVGNKLLYPNGDIQHVGVALGKSGVAGHVFSGSDPKSPEMRLITSSCFQVSAVTFACALISKSNFESLGELSERFPVGLNDVDFCMSAADNGLINLVCCKGSPIHGESKSRGKPTSLRNLVRNSKDVIRFLRLNDPEKLRDGFFQ